MTTRLIENFTEDLNKRADDLAAAPNPAAVRAIVQEARADAVLRTPVPNTFVYQVTVVVLGLSVLAVIVAQVWLARDRIDIPEAIIAIGSAAIGALAGMLTPSSAR